MLPTAVYFFPAKKKIGANSKKFFAKIVRAAVYRLHAIETSRAKIDGKNCRWQRWPHEAIQAVGVEDMLQTTTKAGSCEASESEV